MAGARGQHDCANMEKFGTLSSESSHLKKQYETLHDDLRQQAQNLQDVEKNLRDSLNCIKEKYGSVLQEVGSKLGHSLDLTQTIAARSNEIIDVLDQFGDAIERHGYKLSDIDDVKANINSIDDRVVNIEKDITKWKTIFKFILWIGGGSATAMTIILKFKEIIGFLHGLFYPVVK